ncbi:CoA transferase [Massilia oculi]|uniref:CoA transferase n=1 Tax=Massilia hydrophila TaxID=3044279 RepID=A0ABS7YCD5_9BURK|nr:CoA transferase [Massilia oculi]MCA1857358.1 CoA transferase [Massilia oculi]
MSLPLAGVRIVAVEQYGAGPFGSMYLADLGAEVIKIENPHSGGDVARASGPFFLGEGDSQFFQTFNRNKKSLSLDLKQPAGRAVFERLVMSADAVMNNLRGDQPDKLGLTYAALSHLKPALVCAHLSAYGRDNERAAWPGYDYLMQAEAGYMHLTGEPDGPPTRMGLSMVDYMTGITTALALSAALVGAGRTGRGRDVDVSLFDVALHQLTYPGTWYLNGGHVTTRQPASAHPSTVPCQAFATADGWIFVMCMTEKFWQSLLEVLDAPALASDPRFASVAGRAEHRAALLPQLQQAFRARPSAHWLAALAGRIPIAPICALDTALDNPHVAATGMLQSLDHPQGPLRVLSNPIKVNGARLPGRACPPMGADNAGLLAELGYGPGDIAALAQAGVL